MSDVVSAGLVVCVCLGGCAEGLVSRSFSVAPLVAPTSPCVVRSERLTEKEADGEQMAEMGTTCLEAEDQASPGWMESQPRFQGALFGNACAMGGDVVVPMDTCVLGGAGGRVLPGLRYRVYRRRERPTDGPTATRPTRTLATPPEVRLTGHHASYDKSARCDGEVAQSGVRLASDKLKARYVLEQHSQLEILEGDEVVSSESVPVTATVEELCRYATLRLVQLSADAP